MVGRTQCEAERLFERQAQKMEYLANGAATVLAVSTVTLNAPVAATALLFHVVFNVAAHVGKTHAQKLEEGCKREHYEQGKKDAAAAASGTTSSSTTDSGHHDGPTNSGRVAHCGNMWIPGYVTEDENGINVTSGKSVRVCFPIVLDLDGDGIEYRTLSAPILTDTDGDGRKEERAWVGSDDGLLFWDANADGLGQHQETVLAHFVEGAHTDLEALHAFDSNDDGRIDSADSYYTSLKVGRDLNQNGFFETNEVFSLAQLGIARIDLVAGVQHVSDHDAPVEKLPGVYEFHTASSSAPTAPSAASPMPRWKRRPIRSWPIRPRPRPSSPMAAPMLSCTKQQARSH